MLACLKSSASRNAPTQTTALTRFKLSSSTGLPVSPRFCQCTNVADCIPRPGCFIASYKPKPNYCDPFPWNCHDVVWQNTLIKCFWWLLGFVGPCFHSMFKQKRNMLIPTGIVIRTWRWGSKECPRRNKWQQTSKGDRACRWIKWSGVTVTIMVITIVHIPLHIAEIPKCQIAVQWCFDKRLLFCSPFLGTYGLGGTCLTCERFGDACLVAKASVST